LVDLFAFSSNDVIVVESGVYYTVIGNLFGVMRSRPVALILLSQILFHLRFFVGVIPAFLVMRGMIEINIGVSHGIRGIVDHCSSLFFGWRSW